MKHKRNIISMSETRNIDLLRLDGMIGCKGVVTYTWYLNNIKRRTK